MRVVCDASALVALLLDAGPDGRWATHELSDADLAAPSLIAYETAEIIRRHELAARISRDQAAQAHTDLLDFPIEHWPYELLAPAPGSCAGTSPATTRATSRSPSSPPRR